MQLSETERLILANQYDILSRLAKEDKEKQRFEQNIEILLNGYEILYEELSTSLTGKDHVVTENESKIVHAVLDMFLAIDYAIRNGVNIEGLPQHLLRFHGFSINGESKQLRYAKFISRRYGDHYQNITEDLWGEKFDVYTALLPGYLKMLDEYIKSADQHRLTREDLERITSAKTR